MSWRKGERERAEARAFDRVRGRVVSGIHVGQLRPNDRLASYREVARETGIDLRAAARVYARLAAEGLVEVRGKTGVYVTATHGNGAGAHVDMVRWPVAVLREAWGRGVALPHVPNFLRRCLGTGQLRTACIESTEDQLVTLCTELARDFGLQTTPVHADVLFSQRDGCLPPAVPEADFLTTTTFHAGMLRPFAEKLQKPLFVFRISSEFVSLVQRYLDRGELLLVCADPGFLPRFRMVLAAERPDRVHGVPAAEWTRGQMRRIEKPIFVTNAAACKLGNSNTPLSIHAPGSPLMSADSAAELIELIVQLNIARPQRG